MTGINKNKTLMGMILTGEDNNTFQCYLIQTNATCSGLGDNVVV